MSVVIPDGKVESFGDSYYQFVCDQDVIRWITPLLQGAGYKLRDVDGKIEVELQIAWETPWHHIYHDAFFDCHIWHKVMFDFLSRSLPAGRQFAPISCQQCWKVVARPKTLAGLFALKDVQQRLAMPSKCGLETRPNVHGLYGGYWYNHSLPFGLECCQKVREAVDQDPTLAPVTDDAAEWTRADKGTITQEQVHLETLVNRWFVRDHTVRKQPDHAIANVHRKWIEYAYANGDRTYLQYTGGRPLYRPYVTYHHLLELPEEEREKEVEKFHRIYPFEYNLP